ncbi:MAG: RNA polymerase sigma factor WhiG [Nitriliruptor sp.]|nr:MAG: RNA polymerase sigma factor WhiG [Nitriliruptor sp.]
MDRLGAGTERGAGSVAGTARGPSVSSNAITEREVAQLWGEYADGRDAAVRERLIIHYAPLVKYVAGRVAVGMPAHVEHSDLVSYGIFGLMDAIEKFEPGRGFKFETYAVARIRGAIIDELRSVDWVPRSVRTRSRKVEAAMQELESTLKRSPTEEELAEELGWSLEELQDTLARMSMTSIAALDEVLDVGDGDRITLVDTLQDLTVSLPEETLDDSETKRLLRATLTRLTEREQTVLGLYYFEGMTLAQIGDVLGVTESRICQIHTKAVLSLRTKLGELIRG